MSKEICVGIIGGSGVYNIDEVQTINRHQVSTPFGEPSDAILELELEGQKFLFLPRHGQGHVISPSEINYRANIYAMKKLGVTHLLSISAVGSLKEELAPGTFFLPDQFIDWTKGFRKRSFFGEGMVGHVSTAVPVEPGLMNRAKQALENANIPHNAGGSYICIEGPQFSSKAESNIYRSFGASVIGMTNVPESYLAKEAGLAYATVAMVTDYDCWKEEHCTLEEILNVMKGNYDKAKSFLKEIIPSLYNDPVEYTAENQYSVVTNETKLGPEHKEILEVILK